MLSDNIDTEKNRMLHLMQYLRLPLPEDIAKAKDAGDFDRALKLTDIRLCDPAQSEAMKKRLLLEKEILFRLPGEYPYSEEEALALIQKEIPDFTQEELDAWMDRGDADWFMVNGKRHLQDRFFDSMKKVYPSLAKRAGEEPASSDLLDENISSMKENGSAAWKIHLRHTLRLKDEAFEKGKVLVHLPIPAECQNMSDIHILKTEPQDVYIATSNSESRTVSWSVNLTENSPFAVEYEYLSTVNYSNPDPSEAVIRTYEIEEAEPELVITPLIRALAGELAGGETNPLLKARRFYDFVTERVTYSFMREYITLGHIGDYCASRLRGDCGVQALLFIELCRCAGIPAKWQSGKYVTPEYTGNHDWAMFYIEPWGWLFADCSFGGSAYRAGAKERHDFYFGNLDPFRMAANNALMKEFTPPKQHWRIDPYDNQSGEAEYEHRGLRHDELISECEVIEMRKVR